MTNICLYLGWPMAMLNAPYMGQTRPTLVSIGNLHVGWGFHPVSSSLASSPWSSSNLDEKSYNKFQKPAPNVFPKKIRTSQRPGQLFLLMLRLQSQLWVGTPLVAAMVHCTLQQSPPLIVLRIFMSFKGG